MEISDSDQDVIDAIVGTIKKAEAGDPEVELRPYIDQIVDLSRVLIDNNYGLKLFVEQMRAQANRNSITHWATGDHLMSNSPWGALADRLDPLI